MYVSRTFEFHPEDRRNNGEITITFEVRKTDKLGTWEMEGPGVENRNLGPGVFTLRFKRNSPQQLVSLKINPDPGGGRVP